MTTPERPTEAVLRVLEKAGLDLGRTQIFFHGTTLGLNLLLEGAGAKVGLLTTAGFRDVLEIGRASWPRYQLHWRKPPPLIPRHLRSEVRERVRADGEVLITPDEDEMRAAVAALLERGIEALAVCFLHSYAYPAHEQLVGDLVAAEHPHLPCVLSHRITREYREFERTATTVTEAMIKARVGSYIEELESRLGERGLRGSLLVTRCDGGAMTPREVLQRSIRTLTSGPASGVVGAATVGRWLGIDNLIAADMGGTSFDAALIVRGEPSIQRVVELHGMPLLMPAIDIATIGAGGGSIAWIDDGGALAVGPRSAGAKPGPICYGAGGEEPTFTDAALVSGLISPTSFLGGELPLDIEAAHRGIETRIAHPLGLDAIAAASGIVTLTEAKIASVLEELTVAKGHDPRTFALVAYGGGGPLVAAALARRLDIPRVIVPPSPATFSAWGMLTLDVVHDFARTAVDALEELEPEEIAQALQALEADASEILAREDIPTEARRYLRSIDMRYEDQEHAVTVRVPSPTEGGFSHAELAQAFHEQHRLEYGYSMPNAVEVVAYRLRSIGLLAKPRPPALPSASRQPVPVARRWAVHRESPGEMDWSVYRRDELAAGSRLSGPAIVEEETTSTLVGVLQSLLVDELGNLIISTDGPR